MRRGTRSKIFWEAIYFYLNFFDNCQNYNLTSFYGEAQISIKFYVKIFFWSSLVFLVVNGVKAIDFLNKFARSKKGLHNKS